MKHFNAICCCFCHWCLQLSSGPADSHSLQCDLQLQELLIHYYCAWAGRTCSRWWICPSQPLSVEAIKKQKMTSSVRLDVGLEGLIVDFAPESWDFLSMNRMIFLTTDLYVSVWFRFYFLSIQRQSCSMWRLTRSARWPHTCSATAQTPRGRSVAGLHRPGKGDKLSSGLVLDHRCGSLRRSVVIEAFV